MFRYSQ